MRGMCIPVAVCLALALLLPGCGARAEEDAAAGYRFTDALGREVAVHRPQRVVALMGGFAEIWLLAGGELAGVTDDAVNERGLALPEQTAVVGKYNSPSSERILALDPDLVLLSSETAAHVALRDLLDAAGVQAAYFGVTHFEDYLHMLRICTDITGNTEAYALHGRRVEEEIEVLLAAAPQREPAPTAVLMITHSGGAAAQDSESMAGRMLRETGFVNLADEAGGALRELSAEYLIEADPDYIFVIPMGNDEDLARSNLAAVESHPAWQGLAAVREGRYILLPRELFLYKPNARWAESYALLLELRER